MNHKLQDCQLARIRAELPGQWSASPLDGRRFLQAVRSSDRSAFALWTHINLNIKIHKVAQSANCPSALATKEAHIDQQSNSPCEHSRVRRAFFNCAQLSAFRGRARFWNMILNILKVDITSCLPFQLNHKKKLVSNRRTFRNCK